MHMYVSQKGCANELFNMISLLHTCVQYILVHKYVCVHGYLYV